MALSEPRAPVRRAAALLIADPTGVLRIRRGTQYRCMLFALEGELDGRTAPWLTQQMLAACEGRSGDVLVLILRRLTYFGAAGLHALDTVARAAAEHDLRMAIWDAPPIARRVLRTGGLDPSILIEPPD